MALISRTASYTTHLDAEHVRERALAWFGRLPHRIVSDTPGQIEVTTGSQTKMRLLGGIFIAGTSLPALTVLTMLASDGGTQVTVRADDRMGVGHKAGMVGKYEQCLQEIVTGIQTATT